MTVVDVTGGELRGCCQATVDTVGLSINVCATTFVGHRGVPVHNMERKVIAIVYAIIIAAAVIGIQTWINVIQNY